MPGATTQPGQMRAEGRIEPFNVGSVNNTCPVLGGGNQVIYLLRVALSNPSFNFQTCR
jgi:hypothetical protein